MSNLKKKKYIALLAIVVIVIGIIGLFTFGRIDKYKGKIRIKNVVSKTTSLSASISAVADNETQSKGTDIIKYEIGYTMDAVTGVDARDVVINARINDEQGRYARFKEVTGSNITSTLSNDGKEIEVIIEDAPLGVENNITLRLNINNAPNGFKVRPQITVREATGDESNVVVNEVEVVTNSIVGTVKDSKNLNVSNIELSLRDENGEVKRTYTDEDGRYVFSDIENKTYTVNVEEEIYAKVSEEEVEGNLIIKVKEVTPYELEAHKYITKLDLVVNGKEEHYTYNDLEKVVQNVKNARTISGKIGYKISIKNIGDKAGRISKITDTVDDGLSFDKNKNLGWKEKEGKLYYEMAEGSVINSKETKDITLVLDIKNTNQIKTYINEADVNGETYERVVYILNGEKYREEDVILGEKLVEPVITDPSFSGWYTDKNYTNKYNFKNEVTKDLILYGNTEIVKHSVEFYDKNPETGTETKWDEKEVEHGKKVSRPTDPTHTGYTFECWMDEQENIWNFNNPVERDLRLTSCYTINKYTVLFIDGNSEYNRQQVNYKGNIVVPENPTKQYYTFEFWRLNNEDSAYDLTTPVTENVTLYSKYQRNKHTITFVDKHPSTEEVVTREEEEVNEGDRVTPPVDPTKPGYTFKCWTKSNGTCYDFTKPVLEDEELTSKYTIIEYTITYNGLTNGEKESLNNPTTYTVEDEITLNNPENRYDQDHDLSEIFVGWTGSNGDDPSTEVKIVKGTTGNKEYTANWVDADPDIYPITYNLKNGHLDEGKTNPTSYTKKTATFTLNNPKKTGYNFTGWSGTDLVGQDNLEVTVAKGSRGARSYEAFYSPKNYSIEYVNNCGTVQNPENYTIETPTFTLNNPTKDGYTFTGWKTEDDDTKVLNVTIPIGSTGNRKYIATCEPIEYRINYNLDGGHLKEGKTNPETYTIESPDITLNNPTKDHYNFTGWTGTGLDSLTNPVVIPTGSMGDREYTANYELITHNVTFNDYDVESDTPESTIVQFGDTVSVTDGDPVDAPNTNPTHTGYTCDKWSKKINGNYNNDAYDFSSEVTEDLTLYTLCKKNSYTVTYMDGDNQFAVDTVLYKEKTTKPADDPTKNHHIFTGWTLNGTLFDFNTPITDNITLYSSYEEVKAPEVSHIPTEWTNQDVTVTVSKNSSLDDATGYTYKYRVEDGTYSTYEGPFSIGENCDIYAIAYKSGVASEETKHEIRNIDKIKPIIDDLAQSSGTGTSVEINFTSHDNESGVGEHRIYLDDEYRGTISYTGNPQTKTDSYEITGLTAGQSYIVKLYAVDVAGNISDVSELEVTTEDKIVCQIIGRNNQLYEDESLNEPFSTLRGAIQSCGQNQCTIQMLESVNETNDVLYGQDITLDLNGKNVSGVRDYTLDISGDFILIDDGETKGMIYNNVDSAVKIEANGRFTMGINEILDVDVSTTTPYVWGKYYGVKRLEDATFNFYDGAVRGEVAISGEVDDAPYMYTASVTSYDDQDTPYQVATLKILDDAEARIKTKYYTKLATAVAEAKKGYYENLMSDSTLDDNLKKSEGFEFGFVKNEQGFLVNENTTKYSNAQSEFNISLEGLDVDKELVLSVIRTSDEPDNDSAQIYVSEYEVSTDPDSSANPSGSSYTINVPVGENKFYVPLNKNHIYNIRLYHYIRSETPENSKFIVNDMYLKNVEKDEEDTSIDKENVTNYTKQYGFDYDEETGTYTSNNNFEKGTKAFSFVEFDLTSESVDKLLTLRATYDGMYSGDYGNVIIKENNNIEDYSNYNGLVYLYAYNSNQRNYIGPYNYQTKLAAGKKYYVQFYYFKSSSSLPKAAYEATGCNDEFKIFDIRLTNYDIAIPSTSSTTYNLRTEDGISKLVKNTEYGYDNKNGSYYGYTYNTYDAYIADSYIKYDLTNSTAGKSIQLNHGYGCYNTDVGCKFYAVVTDSPDTPETTDGAFVLRENNTQVTNTKGVLEPGKVNYLHFVFDKPVNQGEPGGNYSSSYVNLNSLDIYEGVNYPLSKSMVTEGEYGWTGSSSMSNNNSSTSQQGTTAHSYMKIDLTGHDFAEYLKLNLYGYADFAIIVNDNKNEPTSRDGAEFTNQDGTYFSGDALIKLVPNQVNYVHFLSTNYSNKTITIYDQTYRYPGEPVNLSSKLKRSPNKGKGFTYDSNSGYYTPGSISQGETADSYIEIDLTSAEKDKILDMNLYLNTYDKNYKYVYLSNSKNAIGYNTIKNDRENALIYYSSANSYNYYINGNNVAYNDTHFNTVLPKGNKYYVHFATYGQTTYTSDYLKIKNVSLSDSNETDFRTGFIPYYDTSHTSEAPELPGDEVIDEANEGNFRFIGSNPSNYITFNNENWRIIGIFNVEGETGVKEKRLKITRDSNFSGYIYDSTPYVTTGPPVNGGQGINEWSQADLMKLLNPGFEDNEEEIFKQEGTSYVSDGVKSVNNSLYWNKGSGICMSNLYNQVMTCDFSSSGLSDTAKEFIDTVVWNTGAIPYNTNVSPYSIYSYEKGNKTTKSSTYDTAGVDDTVERTTKWLGKVGLPSISDYLMATGDFYNNGSLIYTREQCLNMETTAYGACTSSNDWFYSSNSSPMTPMNAVFGPNSSGSNPTLSYVPYAATVYSGAMPAFVHNYNIKPTVYLSTKTKITGGNGTYNSPYTIELGAEKNPDENYGFVPSAEDDPDASVIEQETDSIDWDKVKKEPTYGFTYNQETDEFINDNINVPKSTASSYVEIDLTNEVEDKELNVSIDMSSPGGYAYILLMQDSFKDINYTNLYNDGEIDGTKYLSTSANGINSRTYNLTHGKKYYLQFIYRKYSETGVTDYYSDTLKVKMNINADTLHTTEMKSFDGRVPVLNEEVDTVQILKNISSPSTITVEQTKDMILDLNGYTLTSTSNDYVIRNNGSLRVIDSGYDREEAISEAEYAIATNSYNEQKQSYIAKVAQDKIDRETAMEEYNQRSYVNDGLMINLSSKEYGETENVWKDLSGNDLDQTINGTYIDAETGGYNYSLGISDINEQDNTITYEYTLIANGSGSIFNDKNGIYASYQNNTTYTNRLAVDQNSRDSDNPYALTFIESNKFTLTLVKTNTLVKCYVNGVLFDSFVAENQDKYTSIGFHGGKSLGIRVYNRALTESEIKHNFDVDNALYDLKTIDGDALLSYEFTGATNNDLIAELQDSFWRNSRRVYTLGERTSENYGVYQYVRSTKPYPFYTDFTQIKVNVTKENLTDTLYIGLAKNLPSTPDTTFDISFYDKYITVPSNDEAVNKEYVIKPETNGDYFLVVMSSKGHIVNSASFSVEAPVKETVTYNGTIRGSRGIIYNARNAYLNVEEGIIHSDTTGSYPAIDNYGSVTLGDHGVIKGTPQYGIYNHDYGDILDGTGSFERIDAIYNSGRIDEGFGGYSGDIYATITLDAYNKDYTLNNLSGFTVINKTSSKLTVNDSNIYSFTEKNTGTIELNNSTAYQTSAEKGKTYINNSTVTYRSNVTKGGKIFFDNSTVGSISGDYGSNTLEDVYLKDSEVTCERSNAIMYYIDNATIEGTLSLGERCNGNSLYTYETITLGNKEDEVDTLNPKINRISAPLINFYDGRVNNFTKIINDIPDDYEITMIHDESDDLDYYTLGQEEVAEINGTKYRTLAAAIEDVPDNSHTIIKILKNIYNVRPITIPENKIITIDYNGHSVNSFGNDFITNNGVLTLDDLTGEPLESKVLGNFIVNNGEFNHGNVKNNNYDAIDTAKTIINNGTFNMNSGDLWSKTVTVSGSVYPKIDNNNTINITGGSISSYTNNAQGSTISIDGGTVGSTIINSGDTIITGGKLSNNSITNNNNLTISGLDNGNDVITNINSSGNTLIENTTMNSAITVSGGTTNIKDSLIRQTGYTALDVAGSSTSKAILDNSTIECNASYTAVIIKGSATVDMINNSKVIDSLDHTKSYDGISISGSGNLNLISGEVSRIRAISNSGNGNIVFGTKDGEASKTNPSIKGINSGFNNTNSSSKVYFYDGIFAGPVNASLTSVVTEVETGYEIITIDDTLGEAKVLSGDPLVKNTTTNEEYDNLQQAFDESSEGDTLVLLRDLTTLTSYPTVTVGSDVDVTFDTKGFNIIYNGTTGSFIENNGKLQIVDTNGSTIITNNTIHSIVDNKSTGDLNITDIDITLVSTSYFVNNAGTANISSITLNTHTGDMIINSGVASVSSCTYNDSKNNAGIFISNSGTIELTNNDFRISKADNAINPILILNTGNVNITDGKYYSYSSIVLRNNGGLVSMNQENSLILDGAVNNNNDASIIFNGGRITSTYYDFYDQKMSLNGNSTLTQNGGVIGLKTSLKGSSKLNVYGGSYESSSYTITAEEDTVITLGHKDDNIDLNMALINGYIASEGTINIYDGRIRNGTVYAKEINIEDNSALIRDNTDGTHIVYDNQIKNVEQDKEYVDIQEAINEVASDETLQLINSGVKIQRSQLAIPTGKNFTLDLNGKSISSIKEDIVNNGHVLITNSSSSSSSIGLQIYNDGTSSVEYRLLTNKNYLKLTGKISLSNTTENSSNSELIVGITNNSITKVSNHGAFTLDSGTVNTIYNASPATMNGGGYYNLDNHARFTINNGSIGKTNNSSTLNIINGTSTGGSGPESDARIYNTSYVTIDNITCTNCANFIYSTRNVTINGGTYEIPLGSGDDPLIHAYNSGNVNINGGTYTAGSSTYSSIIKTTTSYSTGPTVNIKDVTTNIPIGSVDSKLTLDNVTVNSNLNSPILTIKEKGDVTVKDNVSLTSTKREAINNKGKLYLGTKDGNVSITSPVLKGETKGLVNETGSSFYFYDGIISGKEAAISGSVTQTETDYSVKITDDGTYKNAFLKTTADIEKVVVVNNINYDTIQAAVNAVEENKPTDMILYTNYTLEDNIVIPANKTIEFYLNGFTINYNSYAFTGDGTINFHDGVPSGVSGAIYRFFANITGTEINPKDIVIYQMDNGEELSPATTYKLYKLMDGEYKVVRVKENEIGDYSLGAEKEILRTTTGQINIKGIGEGNYKLVGSDSKELVFDINENSVSSNIRVDRYSSKASQTLHVVATLILTLQTGVIRKPFMILIAILLLTTIGFITYKKYRKEDLK